MKFTRVWTCGRGHNRVYKVDDSKPKCPICDEFMRKADINALPALNSKAEVEVEMIEVEDPDAPAVDVYDDRITEPTTATKLVPKPEWRGERGYPGKQKYKKVKKGMKFDEKTQTLKPGRGRFPKEEDQEQAKKSGRPKKNDKVGAE